MPFVRFLATSLFVVTVAIPTVFAGGNSETESTTTGSTDEGVETTAAAPVHRELTDAERQEIQEILAEFGVQTFRGSIDAVDFSLAQLSGGNVSLSDYAGEFVFLNFWATWCPPCREEMPSMETLHTTMQGEPFRMVAVNVREDRDTVGGFIDEFGYTYPILLDTDGRVSTNYGVRGIPTTYFIGPDGSVLGMLVGTRYWDEAGVVEGMQRIAEIVVTQ